MPDAILKVDFASQGAGAGAAPGTYPIRPTRIQFTTTNTRARYSVRYNPGTMTVDSQPRIKFVRQAKAGPFALPAPSGNKAYTLPVPPTSGNMLVAVLASRSTDFGDGMHASAVTAVKNGIGGAYTRVGGAAYAASYVDTDLDNTPLLDDYSVLSMWYKTAVDQTDDKDVAFDYTTDNTIAGAAFELYVLEYARASTGIALTDQVKGSHAGAHGTGGPTGVGTFSLPDLDLDGTNGQMVLAAYAQLSIGDGSPSVNYKPRVQNEGGSGLFTTILERANLSGAGQQNPTYKLTAGQKRGFVGMAAAFTKA